MLTKALQIRIHFIKRLALPVGNRARQPQQPHRANLLFLTAASFFSIAAAAFESGQKRIFSRTLKRKSLPDGILARSISIAPIACVVVGPPPCPVAVIFPARARRGKHERRFPARKPAAASQAPIADAIFL